MRLQNGISNSVSAVHAQISDFVESRDQKPAVARGPIPSPLHRLAPPHFAIIKRQRPPDIRAGFLSITLPPLPAPRSNASHTHTLFTTCAEDLLYNAALFGGEMTHA